MIRQHKKMILLTSIATLLPILIGLLLWKQLPDSVATHFFQNLQLAQLAGAEVLSDVLLEIFLIFFHSFVLI